MTILPRYEDAFRSLTSEELGVLLPALSLPLTDAQGRPHTGQWLLDHCQANRISQADVCLSIYYDLSVTAVSAIERLIMRPIDRRTAYEVELSRMARPPGSHHRMPRPPKGSRPGTIPTTAIIRIVAESNPKKPGSESHRRFALYTDGMTVEAFLDAGGRKADLSWDTEKGYINLTEGDEA